MEVGVLLVTLTLVFVTSLLISALGAGTFFSLLSISTVLGGILLYAGGGEGIFRKLLSGKE